MSILITFPNIDVNLLTFSAGEIHVQLENLPKKMPCKVDIRASIQNSDDLMAMLLVVDALRSHYGERLVINLEIPYFPYARQDRVCSIGQAFSLQVVAKIVSDLNVASITIWDSHSPVTLALTGAININQERIIHMNESLVSLLQDDKSVLVCPDEGAKDKCKRVKEAFLVRNMIFAEKSREPSTGAITDLKIPSTDLGGRTAIIIDDICDGGRTFIEIAKRLKEKNISRIILYVTHGIFSKGVEVFDGLIDEIYTTNSFPQTSSPKITLINFNSSKTI